MHLCKSEMRLSAWRGCSGGGQGLSELGVIWEVELEGLFPGLKENKESDGYKVWGLS